MDERLLELWLRDAQRQARWHSSRRPPALMTPAELMREAADRRRLCLLALVLTTELVALLFLT